jgi:uncharacterized DUF497 family protein
MEITFDPTKNDVNIAKHGVSLVEAANIEWDTAITVPDMRDNYGENRLIALAYIGDRIYCMVYVIRDEQLRVISLRKANSREVKRYAET